MASKNDVLNLLRIFALRKKSQVIAFGEFVEFAQKYSEQKKTEIPSLAGIINDTQIQLTAFLDDLAEDKRCAIVYDQGRIGSVVYPSFYSELVKRNYKDIFNEPETPFPNESTLEIRIPSDSVRAIDVKADFVQLLGETGKASSELLRLNYPEGIHNMLVPSDLIREQLLSICVEKIRLYLNTQRNSFYMLSKLRGVFRSKEQILRDMINSVVTQRTQAIETIHNPTEFSFSFWTHLANAIIREYRDKTNKLEREHSYCQAAYLLGFYNVYFKGIIQKKKDTDAALKSLDRRIRQAPYSFTLTEIDNFKDGQGLLLTRKYSREELHKYIEVKTKPVDGESLPEIFRLKATGKNEYYVAKESLLPLTAKKINDASKEYRKTCLETWMAQLKNLQKTEEMKSDEALAKHIDGKVRAEDPLLGALLSYDILYLTLQDSKPRYDVNQEISRILDTSNSSLVPMDQILGLNRRDILSQAKMNLPLWVTIPVLNRLFGFFKRFLSGDQLRPQKKKKKKKKKAPAEKTADVKGAKLLGSQTDAPVVTPAVESSPRESQGRSARAQVQALQNAMASLKLQFVGTGSIDESMEELTEKWNPLYDPVAKANLVEDVNSLVRDFLRKLKRGFLVKPPDAARIRNMADSLANNHAFDQIKKRDSLKRYIELYMISVLGGKQ